MYTVETICQKAKFNLFNWILCIVASLEVLLCFKMFNSFSEQPDVQFGIVCLYGLFLIADLCFMVINAIRVKKITEGNFYVYEDEDYWIIEDEYFILDIVPLNTKFDDFVKSKIA